MGIARSGVGWFIAKIGGLGATWLASLYFARALVDPTATLGQFYLFETIVSFAVLVGNGGVIAASQKLISERKNEGQYVGATLLLSTVLVAATTVAIVLASPIITDYFDQGVVVVVLLVASVWANQVKNTTGSILKSFSQVGRGGGVGFLDSGTQGAMQVLFVALGLGLLGLIYGAVMGTIVAATAGVALLYFTPLSRQEVSLPTVGQVKRLLGFAKYAFLSGFATKFYDNIDILVITYFLGASATGVYGIGFRFSLVLAVVSGAISTSSLPEISRHSAAGEDGRVKEILTDALIFSTVLAMPALAGMVIIARPLIVTFYTGSFAGATIIATIAVAIQIPDGVRSVFTTAANAIDRPELPFRGGVILVSTNLVLDVLLVPTVGPIGAVVASLVGITLATIYVAYGVLSELSVTWRGLPWRQFGAEIFAAVVMAAVVYLLKQTLGLPITPELGLLVVVGVVTYFAVLLAISAEIRRRMWGIAGDLLPKLS